MGRNAQPIDILVARGKSHLTKKQKELRKNAQIRFGGQEINCPDYVLKNGDALDKWAEISTLYDGFDFVSAGDAGLIGRYCMTYAEYMDLIARRRRIDQIAQNCDDVDQYLSDNDEEFNFHLRKKLLDLCSTAGVLSLDTAINKKMEMLIKMEDRLFLNPLAKIKNVPKQQEEMPQDPMQKAGFGDV